MRSTLNLKTLALLAASVALISACTTPAVKLEEKAPTPVVENQ